MRHFDLEINELKKQLVDMAALVREMIKSIMDQLISKNADFHDKLFAIEKEVNIQEIVIDDKCLKLIALNQPVGTDLRFITSAMKINTDLERMADEAIGIAKKIDINLDVIENVSKMAGIVRQMVEDAINAFNKSDVDLANSVLDKDRELSNLKDEILQRLKESMMKSTDSEMIGKYLDQVMMLRNIQRIGDHATNISEDVIFMVQGKDIRHPKAFSK
ncbi:MAG: phosphate signaling complex protein PhoU [Elusimicrobiota bacterium]|jgi:phosphate transport system protein|nr:phosphate signaling complex protein PhoU [Elusimicrobiota bacterium]